MRSVIVVFGSATRPNGLPGKSLSARLKRALHEARLDPRAPIVVSGGAVLGPAEGPVMRRWLVARGVPAQRIIVEAQALYTLDNAMRVAPLIAGMRAATVKLVTSAAHMPRSTVLLERELRAVTGRSHRVLERPARDAVTPANAQAEQDKLARDLATQAALPPRRQSPKMVRAQAWAGSMRMHKSSHAGA